PSSVTTDEGTTANFQLQASDADGDALQYIITQPPAHGNVTVAVQTGMASYSPAANYCGPDSFKFKVNDGKCDSAEATVSITVNCAPPAPPNCVARVAPDGCNVTFPGQS